MLIIKVKQKSKFIYGISMLLFTISMFGCFNMNEKKKSTTSIAIFDTLAIGKQLTIPDSLEVYKPFDNYSLDSNEIAKSSLKIYTFVDVSCSSCIDNIKKWNLIMPSFDNYKVPVIMVCQSRDNFELFKFFCESGKVGKLYYPFFLDKSEKYFKLNPFINHSNHTLLTTQNNKIVGIGDPSHSDVVLKEFVFLIQKENGFK